MVDFVIPPLMKNRIAFIFLLISAALMSACQHLSEEGPETAPSGPPVISQAAIKQALSGPVSYEAHVRPLLRQNCLPCHDGKQMPGFVNLTSRQSAFSVGPYGRRIVPGKPDESLIIKNLSLTNPPVNSMPHVG